MNDPKKRIDVNLSSLLSLKAELLRKREEAKNINQHQQNHHQKGQFHHHFPKYVEKKVSKSMPPPTSTVSEFEDQMLLEKSRKVLESKAKFYEKMSQSGGSLNSDENCLVMFNQKRQECNNKPQPNEVSSSDSSSSDSEDSEDEAEFIDCLGRTRKCLRKDLEKLKSQDREMSKNMPQKLDTSAANWMMDIPQNINPPESIFTDNLSTVSKHDAQKMNWEKKEEENINKSEIHYQDVFFDEARQHGTGYYAFSTDSDERKKQQQALEDMRKKTLNEQRERETQKLQREKIIAERVKAAKNRQRARLGLPPLEDEPVPETEVKEETREERKQRKKEEKRKRKKENEEAMRAEQRKNHLRPWDHNKDSNSTSPKWQYKPDKDPMSQEQWNEMKRNERNAEFAPPSSKVSRISVENSTYEQRYHPDKYQMLVDKLREEKTREEKPLCTPPESFVPFIPKSSQNHFTMDIDAKLKYIRQNGPNAEWKRRIGPSEHVEDSDPPLFSTDLKSYTDSRTEIEMKKEPELSSEELNRIFGINDNKDF